MDGRWTSLERQWTNLDGQWINSKHSNLDQPGTVNALVTLFVSHPDQISGKGIWAWLNLLVNL